MNLAVFLLAVATFAAFYILILYPVLLAVLRPVPKPPIQKDPQFQASVSVLIAVYNGQAFLRGKLESLFALDYPRRLVQIIIVSDGSTDDTDAIAAEFESSGVRLLRVPKGGKAAALNAALLLATGEILFFTDVRQPLDTQSLSHLVANFADPTVGAVTGELHLLKGDRGEQSDMDLYWRYEIWARSRHSRIDSLFNTTGCIYAMRRRLAVPLPPDTLTDDAFLPQQAFFQGYRIAFDPEAVAYDYPALAGTEFQRRMRTLAGLWQVFVREPRFFTGSRMRWHFLSHKFGRLVLPWTLLVIFIATFFLPSASWRNTLLLNEALLFVLAALDHFVPKGFRLKRISSPARTFLVMNAAAMAAVVVFFVPASRLWSPTRVKDGAGDLLPKTPSNPVIPPGNN